MNREAVRERAPEKQKELSPLEVRRRAESVLTQWQQQRKPSPKPRQQVRPARPPAPVQKQAPRFTDDQLRVEREMRELHETDDLREIDDDVEDVATLVEWYADEHTHRPKSALWYAVLAVSITAISVGFLLFGNIIAAITIALVGGLTYAVAQRDPQEIRYRLLTEGVAFNNVLYHYRDLAAFNIVYEPGETKTVLLRSKKTFSPLFHMEIGDADPVAIRDVLIEFVPEDQEMDEPLVDIWARRLGF